LGKVVYCSYLRTALKGFNLVIGLEVEDQKIAAIREGNHWVIIFLLS
jgi:hypothetical protein